MEWSKKQYSKKRNNDKTTIPFIFFRLHKTTQLILYFFNKIQSWYALSIDYSDLWWFSFQFEIYNGNEISEKLLNVVICSLTLMSFSNSVCLSMNSFWFCYWFCVSPFSIRVCVCVRAFFFGVKLNVGIPIIIIIIIEWPYYGTWAPLCVHLTAFNVAAFINTRQINYDIY